MIASDPHRAVLALVPVAAALICAGLIVLLRPLLQRYALARPNARSSHITPTPQGGGIAVMAATAIAAALTGLLGAPFPGDTIAVVLVAAFCLAVVGMIDDLRPIPVVPRLALQFAAVTLLFAAMLGINRLFVAEREQGGFDAFLLAPADRTALLVAKAIALFAFLSVLELIAVPAFALLLLDPSPWPALPGLIGILALANAGIAVIGTLASALAIQTRARDLIAPLLALPLLIPVVLAAAKASTPLLLAAGPGSVAARWPLILALYDLVFALTAYAVFDFLLED